MTGVPERPGGQGAQVSKYLDGLNGEWQRRLEMANRPGIAALAAYVSDENAIAFLGAGCSTPLYPLWGELVGNLIAHASERGVARERIELYRKLAPRNSDAVVELIRSDLGVARYLEYLRSIFRGKKDAQTAEPWTAIHAAVARIAFRATITTNYDPGILNARAQYGAPASVADFVTWVDEGELDRWRTGDAWLDRSAPVLYAHGIYSAPENIVLAMGEYRRAYSGRLTEVLRTVLTRDHVVWIGFSFADRHFQAILEGVAAMTGPAMARVAVPRHIAIVPLELGDGLDDPLVMRSFIETLYGAEAIFYPVRQGDHSALGALLEELREGFGGALRDT